MYICVVLCFYSILYFTNFLIILFYFVLLLLNLPFFFCTVNIHRSNVLWSIPMWFHKDSWITTSLTLCQENPTDFHFPHPQAVQVEWSGLKLPWLDLDWFMDVSSRITVLDLSHNCLCSLPSVVPWGLIHLRSLNLSHNQLRELPTPASSQEIICSRSVRLPHTAQKPGISTHFRTGSHSRQLSSLSSCLKYFWLDKMTFLSALFIKQLKKILI